MRDLGKFKIAFVCIGLFLVDRFVKQVVIGFEIVYVKNYGVAFGMGNSNVVSLFVSLVGIAYVIYLIRKLKWALPLYLILVGGICNIIDRIVYGAVIDYIDLKFFPVFNLADVYISIGIVLVGFLVYYRSRDKREIK